MASTEKKTEHDEMVERTSVDEARTVHQGRHSSHVEEEPSKDVKSLAGPQDPFMGEEGTQVQYRSMKWW
jgi:hypothetical protein